MKMLVAMFHSVLQSLWIERPPLGEANTPAIRQRGNSARAVTSQPAVGTALPDPVLGNQLPEAAAVLQVLNPSRSRPRCVRRAFRWLCMGARGLGRWVAHQPVATSNALVS